MVENPLANVGDMGDVCLIPGLEDSLEEEMATLSGTLAREIPWSNEPGVLQSMGSQRVGHNFTTKHAHTVVT